MPLATLAGRISRGCSVPSTCWRRLALLLLNRRSFSTPMSCGSVLSAAVPKPSRCASGPFECIRTEYGDGWVFYHELGRCKTWMGQADEGIALEEEADALNPHSPWRFVRYRHIGWYWLLLCRDLDAIKYLERSFAINPDDDGAMHYQYRRLAAAYARTGNVAAARQYLSSAERLWPYDTV